MIDKCKLHSLLLTKLLFLFGFLSCISCDEGVDCEMKIFKNSSQKYVDSTQADVFHLYESVNCYLSKQLYYKKVFIIRQSENDTIMNLLIRKDGNPNYYLVLRRNETIEDTIYFNFQNIKRVSITQPQLAKRDNNHSEYIFFATPGFQRHYYFRINDKGEITKIWSEKNPSLFLTQ